MFLLRAKCYYLPCPAAFASAASSLALSLAWSTFSEACSFSSPAASKDVYHRKILTRRSYLFVRHRASLLIKENFLGRCSKLKDNAYLDLLLWHQLLLHWLCLSLRPLSPTLCLSVHQLYLWLDRFSPRLVLSLLQLNISTVISAVVSKRTKPFCSASCFTSKEVTNYVCEDVFFRISRVYLVLSLWQQLLVHWLCLSLRPLSPKLSLSIHQLHIEHRFRFAMK
jgi:hypothetical protein